VDHGTLDRPTVAGLSIIFLNNYHELKYNTMNTIIVISLRTLGFYLVFFIQLVSVIKKIKTLSHTVTDKVLRTSFLCVVDIWKFYYKERVKL